VGAGVLHRVRIPSSLAITTPPIAGLRSNLVQSFITSHQQALPCKCSRSKVKGQDHTAQSNVSAAKKRYNTAMDRFSDFKSGVVNS